MDREPERDFFISYTAVDDAWARWIAVELERAGYTTVVQAFVDVIQHTGRETRAAWGP